jgi:hypothetical protein
MGLSTLVCVLDYGAQQPHPTPAPGFSDELDPGRFQRGADRSQGTGAGIPSPPSQACMHHSSGLRSTETPASSTIPDMNDSFGRPTIVQMRSIRNIKSAAREKGVRRTGGEGL